MGSREKWIRNNRNHEKKRRRTKYDTRNDNKGFGYSAPRANQQDKKVTLQPRVHQNDDDKLTKIPRKQSQ